MLSKKTKSASYNTCISFWTVFYACALARASVLKVCMFHPHTGKMHARVGMRMLTCAFFLACVWSAIQGYTTEGKKTHHVRTWHANGFEICAQQIHIFLTNSMNIN